MIYSDNYILPSKSALLSSTKMKKTKNPSCKPSHPKMSSEDRAPLLCGHPDHSVRPDALFVLWLPPFEAQKGLQQQGLPRT